MEKIFLILLIFIPFWSFAQNNSDKEKKQKFDLDGIWNITDYKNPEKFIGIWEFISDGTFNELKSGFETYKKDTLIADENGTWTIIDKILTIIVNNEMIGEVRKKYDKPQIMKFKIEKNEIIILLTVIDDGQGNKKESMILKLTKKY